MSVSDNECGSELEVLLIGLGNTFQVLGPLLIGIGTVMCLLKKN